MMASAKRSFLAVFIFGAVVLVVALVPAALAGVVSTGYVRPRSAGPFKVSLVPAYRACTTPNRQHGSPLVGASCNPPAPASSSVTVGTMDANGAAENSEARVIYRVQFGTPGPPDDSDVLVNGSVSDVRCLAGTAACGDANTADGADYTGGLQVSADMRITDRFNGQPGPGGSEAATIVDIPFPARFSCAGTPSPAEGGICTIDTSLNAVVPGAFKDGKRSVIALGPARVSDGGPDGDLGTAPNTNFMTQGVFVP